MNQLNSVKFLKKKRPARCPGIQRTVTPFMVMLCKCMIIKSKFKVYQLLNNVREKNFVVYEDYIIDDLFTKEYGTRHYTVLNINDKLFDDDKNPSIVVWYDKERTKIMRERWFTSNE